MNLCAKSYLFALLVICCAFYVRCSPTSSLLIKNYMITDDLAIGEHETRIHFNGVSAKQTFVGLVDGMAEGLLVRQVSDGIRLLTMVYNGDPNDSSGNPLELRECKFGREEDEVTEFLDDFIDDAIEAKYTVEEVWEGQFENSTYKELESIDDLPSNLREIVDYRALKTQCKLFHKKVRKGIKHQNKLELQKNNNIGHSRNKRSLRELFILPGTKWCGSKSLASNPNEIDGFSYSDKCCRKHDHCPYYIPGMSRKYSLYNARLTTISHCACDHRFRACLKMAGTGASDVVGNIFFSLIKTSCFVFKKEKTCIKYSFYNNKCVEWRKRKVAHLKEPLPWNR